MSEITAYHGTYIDPEEIEDVESPLFTPDGSCNDLGVHWVSNERDDVEYFAAWRNPGPRCLKVIMKGQVDTSRHLEAENDGRVEIGGVEYHALDREEAFEAARRAGYSALNTPGNYPAGGDDIALLEDGEFRVEEFSFLIDGEWTEFMDWDAAEDLVRDHFGLNVLAPAV